MKKIWLSFFLLPLLSWGQATVTGTVFDQGNNPATSGYVQFDLQPANSGVHYYIPGVGVIAPQTTQCGINGSGQVLNSTLTGPCQVWENGQISPGNTTYTVTFAPGGLVSNVISQECINTPTYNLSNPVFCPKISLNPQSVVIITTPIQHNLIPGTDAVFSLGSSLNRYANVFAANGSFTNTTILGTLTALGGGALSGTFTGSPTFSGNVSVSGTLGVGSGTAPTFGLSQPFAP